MADEEKDAGVETAVEEAAAPQTVRVTPQDFPPPSVELTYPAAVVQFHEETGLNGPITVMTTVAKDEDGVVRVRHYPMGPAFAESLEKELQTARGASKPKIEVVPASALRADGYHPFEVLPR